MHQVAKIYSLQMCSTFTTEHTNFISNEYHCHTVAQVRNVCVEKPPLELGHLLIYMGLIIDTPIINCWCITIKLRKHYLRN